VRLGNLQYPDYEFDVDALVDTGFDGGLVFPHSLIPRRVARVGDRLCELADGSFFQAPVYLDFETIGSLQPVDTVVMAFPHQAVLGRAVTNHFKLTFFYGRQIVLEQ
jgi:hypothetical protein